MCLSQKVRFNITPDKAADKFFDMVTEACETALGAEWYEMTDDEKHDLVMEFVKRMLAAYKG